MEVNFTEKIERLRMELPYIRVVCGLTMESLGDLLGCSKQNIYNIEHGCVKMKKIHYLAIRYILDKQIEEHTDFLLRDIIRILVDDDTPEDKKQDIHDCIRMAMLPGYGRKQRICKNTINVRDALVRHKVV